MKVNVTLTLQSCTSHYNAGTWGIVQGQLRPLLAPRVYTLPMVRSIGKTMVQGKNYGPQITVKRISTRSVLQYSSTPTATHGDVCAVLIQAAGILTVCFNYIFIVKSLYF